MSYCRICGKYFESKRGVLCSDCKVGICAVCGKTFNRTWEGRNRKWCSPECKAEYAKQNGGLHKIHTYAPKNCAWCDEEFIPNTPNQKYCNRPHYNPCPVCETPVLIKEFHDPIKCCSDECIKKLRARTNLENCGYENAGAAPENIEKAALTTQIRYGDRIYARTTRYKQHQKAWSLEYCGYTSTFACPEIREAIRQNRFERTGYYESLQLPHVREATMKALSDPEVLRSSAIKRAATRFKTTAFDGTHLDSKYELDVYEFCKRNNLDVSLQIVRSLQDCNHVTHKIIYDFLIDGQLYECKGGHFLDGCWDAHSVSIEDKVRSYEDNDVILITDVDTGFAALDRNFSIYYVRSIDIEVFRIFYLHGDKKHDNIRVHFQDEHDVLTRLQYLLTNNYHRITVIDLVALPPNTDLDQFRG